MIEMFHPSSCALMMMVMNVCLYALRDLWVFGVDEHGFVCVCMLAACCLYMTEIYGVRGILVMFPPATASKKASRI